MFNLIEELSNFITMDNVEECNVKNVLEFLNNNTNCFDRSNLKGHITAGGLVVDKKGSVLLNHHKKTGMWFQFGGHSDGESDSLNVAKREIKEEAGLEDLQLISNKIFDVDVQKIDYSAKRNEPEHYHYDINFLFCTNDKSFKVSNESTEIKWVTIEEAKGLIDKDDEAMKRMIEKYKRFISHENKISSSHRFTRVKNNV